MQKNQIKTIEKKLEHRYLHQEAETYYFVGLFLPPPPGKYSPSK